MGKYKNLMMDTAVFAVGSLGSKIILFFLVPLYTSCLTQEQYGTVELVGTIAELMVPFVSVVVYDAILRFTLDQSRDKSSIILGAMVVFAAGSAATLLLAPALGLHKGMAPWKWYVALYVISYMATQILLTYIKGKGNSKLYVALGLGQTALLAVLNIVLLKFRRLGVEGYLVSNVAAHLGVAVLAFFAGGVARDLRGARLDLALLGRMLRYSAPLILNNVSWWLIKSSDKLMLDHFMGSAAVGLYSVAAKIPALINVFASFFSQAWEISSVREYESMRDAGFYSKVFGMFVFAITFCCACLLPLARPFMSVYVAEGFFEAWRYVPWLLVAAAFFAVSTFFGSIYSLGYNSVGVMLSTLLAGALNIALNLVLIPRIGIAGATAATAASYMFIALYRMLDSRRFFRFDIRFPRFALEFAGLCVSAWAVAARKAPVWLPVGVVLMIGALNFRQAAAAARQLAAAARARRGAGGR